MIRERHGGYWSPVVVPDIDLSCFEIRRIQKIGPTIVGQCQSCKCRRRNGQFSEGMTSLSAIPGRDHTIFSGKNESCCTAGGKKKISCRSTKYDAGR